MIRGMCIVRQNEEVSASAEGVKVIHEAVIPCLNERDHEFGGHMTTRPIN